MTRFARCRYLASLSLTLSLVVGHAELAAQDAPHGTATIPAALLSDPHLDPFRDPGKVKRLTAMPVGAWAAILAEPPSPNAAQDFADLQKTCNEKLADADAALELSALDDAEKAKPAFVLIGGDMLVHAFRCRYKALLDPGGTDKAGLADFAEKTVEFQLRALKERFPATPVHLALGNNDSDCEDYTLDAKSGFLDRLAPAVAGGWAGISAAERRAAMQDFKRFGSYALPLPAAVHHTKLIVLDDLYLSSDYRGTCGNAKNTTTAKALLTWFERQLAAARRAHQAVWVLAHIPPEVNVYRTYLHPHDICHGELPASYFATDSFNDLLTQYADTVRVVISGHTHVDEIHLLENSHAQGPNVALKVIPSITPLSTNAPAYLRVQVDPSTGNLVDYTMRTATVSEAKIAWETAYDFGDTYKESAFTASAVSDLLQRWQKDPDASAEQIGSYQTHLANGLRLFALRASWPQQLCAMQHSSAAGFTACACTATGGLLPPAKEATQKTK